MNDRQILRPRGNPVGRFLLGVPMLDATHAEWDFSIPVDMTDGDATYDGIITNLYDADGQETWRPERATVAVGLFLSGPYLGRPIVIDDITELELKIHVH